MGADDLATLLQRMPEIAEAVNAFTSEKIQQEAFAALVNAYHGKTRPAGAPSDEPVKESEVPNNREGAQSAPDSAKAGATSARKAAKRTSGTGSQKSFSVIKELDLRPAGKTSFEDFIGEKQPNDNQARFPVVVYWLKEIAGYDKVTVDHVGTVFRMKQDWREPTNLLNAMGVCATRKSTLNLSDSSDIRLTPQGRNFVEHDLPAKKKTGKSA